MERLQYVAGCSVGFEIPVQGLRGATSEDELSSVVYVCSPKDYGDS